MSSARSYASGYYIVTVEGKDLGTVQSVDGGATKAELVTQQIGGQNTWVKHIGNPTFEPITLQVGASLSDSFYQWIDNSWRNQVERRNGSIVHYSYDMKPMFEMEFREALIAETTLPPCDASGKGTVYMTVKLQPELICYNTHPKGSRVIGETKPGQKQFSTQNFKFELDAVDCGRVSKVESFTIKQNTKTLPVGAFRTYQVEPTKLEYPNFTITTSLDGADKLFEWHKKMVVDGNGGVEDESTGHLTLYNQSMQKELLEVSLDGVGITSLSVEKSDAMSRNSVKRVKCELYVSECKLKYHA